MSTSLSRRFRRAVAGTAATALAAGSLVLVAGPAQAAPSPVTDAVFAWGLSNEANNAGFAPQTANFFSAGKISNPGAGGQTLTSATTWYNGTTANWSATNGNVEIQKKTADGGYAPATWEGLKTSPTGASISPPTSNVFSDHRVTIKKGTGTADAAANDASITWDGDFTVIGYSGMTFFYVSDPTLTVDDGVGTVTATVGGYGTSMDDMTEWTSLPDTQVTLATLSGVDVTENGFTVTPAYSGVTYDSPNTPQNRTAAGWGAWPATFISAIEPTGQAAYWYTTGGSVDKNKTPLPLTVSYSSPAKVTVSDTTIPSTGEHEITVSGSGFAPALATGARPPLAGKAAGAYVVLGTVADSWKPSAGAPSTARKAITQKWAVTSADMTTIGGAAAGAIELKADGTFTTTFTVSKAAVDAAPDRLAKLGIYTYAGSGATQPLYETFTPITFEDPAPTPTVTLSNTTISSEGEHEITVSGTGFDPNAGTFGLYAGVSRQPAAWKPSEGVALNAAQFPGAAYVPKASISADGTFSTTITVDKSKVDAVATEGSYGVYTFGAHGQTVAAYETFTPITFVDPEPEPEPEPVPAVASTTAIAAPVKVVYGRGGLATVTVKSSKAVTGKVQLLDGARSLGVKGVSGGKATFVLPKTLTVGTHRLTARFTPADAKVVKASTSVRNLAVAKVSTKAAVKVTKKPTRKGAGKATVTVSGTPKANGRVTIVIKGKGIKKTVRATVRNGKVVVKLPKLKKKGTYTLTATYAGSATHTAAKKAVKVKVTH
ncbi:Ig-like domain repeat protein [Mumia sp. DW29H23]|uniref:Ig-like domain repeat protein n=1 Tax=Mumia sp. DW29H23 TaxID=3421241 RepID=UPI003D699B7F